MATRAKDNPNSRVKTTYSPNRLASASDPPVRLSTEKIMMEADAVVANIKGIRISLLFPSGAERQKSTEARE